MRFGHNFCLGGPSGTRSMRLNCISQDLLRDTPLDHIWHAQICAQIWPDTAKYGLLGALNIVEWGSPKNILQNTVQTSLS